MKMILTLVFCVLFAKCAFAVELPAETLALGQWVTLNANSELSGHVDLPQSNGGSTAVAGANVVLIGESDELFRAKTDAAGRFQVSKVKPGIYAMSVFKKGVFSCGALQVVSASHPAAKSFPTEVEFAAAKIDAAMIKSAMIRYLPPTPAKRALEEIADNELTGVAKIVKSRLRDRIVQQAGGLRGNIGVAGASNDQLVAAGSMNVLIVQEGEEVARAITDATGHFEIADLPLGEYCLLAVGPGGFGCAGFVLVDQSEMDNVTKSNDAGDVHLVLQPMNSPRGPYAMEFGMQVGSMPQVVDSVNMSMNSQETVLSDEVVGEEIVDLGIVADGYGAPIPGGGFVPGGGPGFGGGSGFGGGGAGGGFGGGGGGLGGLATLGALGAAIAVAASNNNDGNVIILPPTPVSPVIP